jgi:hypothetical protein
MEKNPDEILMFTRFAERGLSLPASDFFKGLLGYYDIEYLNLNPNGIFHTSVFVQFCEAILGIPLGTIPKILPTEAPAQCQQSPSSGGSRDPDTRRRRRAIPLVQADRLQPRLEVEVVLYHQPPPGTVEAQREAAEAPAWWNSEPTMQEGI